MSGQGSARRPALALAAWLAGAAACRHEPAPPGEEPASPAASSSSRPLPPSSRALAAPFYDLLANRARFRVHDAGLLVSFAGEGFRIYDLALRDAWGPPQPRTADLPASRRLQGKARLLLPWAGGPAELRLRGAGAVTVSIDGKKRPLLTATGEGARLPLGELAAGEHELSLAPKGKPALVSLELAAPAAAGCADSPAAAAPAAAASSVADDERGLDGARAFAITVELPARAAISFTPRGGGEATVAVRGEDGRRRVVWQGRADGNPQLVSLDIEPQLAELSLESPACGVQWQALRLGVLPAPPAAAPPPAPPPAPSRPRRAEHVVMIVVDTLRADRLAAIATTRVRTPRLTAALQRGGVVFANHLSVAPSSPPSHATLQTGLYPRVHGVAGDVAPLREGSPMLSALLAERGFYTGYVGNNDFAMGRLKKPGKWSEFHAPVFEKKGMDCAPIIERALQMLATAVAAKQRAFLSLLPLEPHVPYDFHAGITDTYYAGPYPRPLGKRVTSAHLGRIRARGLPPAGWEQLRALYDGEVTAFDACFGALEDGLTKLGIADQTAILLTSDHGEGMGERDNNTGHAYSLYRELTWVPLYALGGGVAGVANTGTGRKASPADVRRVTSATSNLDLPPTVLELLGEPIDPRMQGASLAPILRGEAPWPRAVASEYGKAYAVAAGRWHYVADYEGRGKLFDVIDDPEELHDRSAEAAVPLRYLREAAAMFLSQRTTWRGADGSLTDLSPAFTSSRRGRATGAR